jgi:tetratricopeptide (TPR) repeat protein
MITSFSIGKRSRWIWVGCVLVLLLVGGIYLMWRYWFTDRRPSEADMFAAAQANARGLALLEWFDEKYQGRPAADQAIEAFEEAVRLTPDWLPARINLGIALLNSRDSDPLQKAEKLQRAAEVFRDILARDPNNPYAHFCLGIWHFDRGEREQALTHFTAVTEIDPQDAHAWYFRGRCTADEFESAQARQCFERALQINPYLNAARHSLTQHASIAADRQAQERLFREFEELRQAEVEDIAAVSYTEMGKYATAIGLPPPLPQRPPVLPMFQEQSATVHLNPQTRWASAEALDPLQQAVRERFGAVMIWCDYDRDGRPDLFLLGAVQRHGSLGDLLLHNEGNGVFRDVSSLAHLEGQPASLGGACADFDNDGWPDVVLTTPHGLRLLRNQQGQGFEDVTHLAGLDKLSGVCLTAQWLDIDQDGDLDLLVCQYATNPTAALKQLQGDTIVHSETGRLAVFLNVGEARPSERGQPFPPLTPAFRFADVESLRIRGAITGLLLTDLDGDQDIDIVVLRDRQAPVVLLNERLLRFRTSEAFAEVSGTLGCVLDANEDEQTDFCLLTVGQAPQLWLSTRDTRTTALLGRFQAHRLDSPPLRQAYVLDLDLDGLPDIVGLSQDRLPVWLRNEGNGKWTRMLAPFGPKAEAIRPQGIGIADLDNHQRTDLVLWSPESGLTLFRHRSHTHHALVLTLSGKWDKGKKQRSNAQGIGARLRVYVGGRRIMTEHTCQSAALGQSYGPLFFGLGPHTTAEAVQIRWPDLVPQSELQLSAGAHTISEINRKSTSCPVLFAWNGERFEFITDILGAGALAELNPDGSVRPPRPEESLKLEPGTLQPHHGHYRLQIAEPMDEVAYLDAVRLDVIDHPADWIVYPDERFAVSPPLPSQRPLFFRNSECLQVQRAVDHRQRDVTDRLQRRDGRYVDGFARRAWLGYAEEHGIECTFGKPTPVERPRRWHLILSGWTDYAYPESIFAATQAGIPTLWPVLEQRSPKGSWQRVCDVGMPAGLPRVMTVPLPPEFDPTAGPLRIRTNLQIYWDHIWLAPEIDLGEQGTKPVIHTLPVHKAVLEHRGFPREVSAGDDSPQRYDYDQLEHVLVSPWQGRLTRTGDVTELLQAPDDLFVLAGPGDAVTFSFDATLLPPLPPGWQRSFILRTWGYSKDTAPTTLSGGQVDPLPYRAMPHYPYDPSRHPPPAQQTEYHKRWNTRPLRHP